MRILQLCSAFAYTGPAEPMLSLSVELHRRGHQVTIAHDTVRPEGNAFEEGIAEPVRKSGLPVASELSLSTRSGPITWARDLTALRRRMREVDICHAHFSHDHALCAAARITGIPTRIVRTVHALRSVSPVLRRADAVIVHSEHARSVVSARIPGERVHVVPGSVDVTRFHPANRAERRRDFRARHNLPEGPALLMTAIFQAGRGQAELVRWWPGVRSVLPDAQLWLAGLGETRDDVIRQAEGIPGITFLGYLNNGLPDAYAAADATVLLRVGNDGFGRGALESLATGTQVLTRQEAHAVADVVRSNQVGRLLDNDAVDHIIRALKDPVPVDTCRTAVERTHTLAHVTTLTEQIYAAVLRPNP